MIVKPRIRGFICTTAHPLGCAESVDAQVRTVKAQAPLTHGPTRVLVLGCSAGYGLASRISAAFGAGAETLGVSFEKAPHGGQDGQRGLLLQPGLRARRCPGGAVDRNARR